MCEIFEQSPHDAKNLNGFGLNTNANSIICFDNEAVYLRQYQEIE
jgi:hypothetical protein